MMKIHSQFFKASQSFSAFGNSFFESFGVAISQNNQIGLNSSASLAAFSFYFRNVLSAPRALISDCGIFGAIADNHGAPFKSGTNNCSVVYFAIFAKKVQLFFGRNVSV